MSQFNAPSPSFLATAAATSYPVDGSPDGTSTAGSSSAIARRIRCLKGIVIEAAGSANGTLTISDHAGTAATDIVLTILTAGPRNIDYGPDGIAVNWLGIKAVMATGTAMSVRIIFDYV